MSRGKNGASGSAENSYMIYDKGSYHDLNRHGSTSSNFESI